MRTNGFGPLIGVVLAGLHAGTTPVSAHDLDQRLVPVCAEQTAGDWTRGPIEDFERRINGYAAMHRLIEGPLPQPSVTTDISTVRAAMDALAVRLQEVRADAREGNVFTPAIARFFQVRIAECLTPEEIDVIVYGADEGSTVAPRPRVNARWPQGAPFGIVPPKLLAALPELPPELQYRIIGRSLLLWDHHADLVVDVLILALGS